MLAVQSQPAAHIKRYRYPHPAAPTVSKIHSSCQKNMPSPCTASCAPVTSYSLPPEHSNLAPAGRRTVAMRLAVPVHRAVVGDLLQVPRPDAGGHELGHWARIPGAVADLLLCVHHTRVEGLWTDAELRQMWQEGGGARTVRSSYLCQALV